MNKYLILPALTFALMLAQGCATLVDGKEQVVTFNSEPEHATVMISGIKIGKTPLSVPIKRDDDVILEVTKDGYRPYKAALGTKTNSWVFGNILFLIYGLFSTTTDSQTGAMTEFSPDKYFVTLSPIGHSINGSKTRKIKEFVVTFGDSIRLELAGSEDGASGEKTDALASLIDSSNKETVTIVLKKLADKSDDDLEFAKKIIDFYDIK